MIMGHTGKGIATKKDVVVGHNIRCTACGAAMEYDPGKPVITCKSCSSNYSFIENLENLSFTECEVSGFNRLAKEWFDFSEQISSDFISPTYEAECFSCGEEIEIQKFITGKCESCGNSFYLPFDEVETKFEPLAIFPFQTTRKDVIKRFKWWYRFNLHRVLFFMQLKFDSEEKVSCCYYPVWLYNVKAHIKYAGRMTPSPVSESQNTSGEFDAEIARLPVHALLSADGKIGTYCTRDLEWDLSEPKLFNPSLITGVKTKPFFLNAEKVAPRAAKVIKQRAVELTKTEIGGAHQEVEKISIKFSEISLTPVLIPVWLAVSSYHGKPVWFCMNGMSGKFIARSPAPEKYQIWVLGVFLSVVFTFFAVYLQYIAEIINVGTVAIAAVFAIFSISSLMAGMKKIFSMKMSLWMALGVDLFYLIISISHFKAMFWYHLAMTSFIGIVTLLWMLSSSDTVDESKYETTDLESID
jgi:hypothetical protein